MALLENSEELNSMLSKWREENRRGVKPTSLIQDISYLLEKEANAYVLQDPDPFDDRHPGRSIPDCVLGHLLKVLCEDEEFVNKLLTSYIFNAENDFELNCAAARLLINLMPALDSNDIFQDTEMQVGKLLTWATDEKEPLRAYACGLLFHAMQIPECPGLFKDRNAVLVPLVVKRLKILSEVSDLDALCIDDINNIAKSVSIKHSGKKKKSEKKESELLVTPKVTSSGNKKRRYSQLSKNKTYEYRTLDLLLSPLTVGMQQILFMRYLHPMGEYQELLPVAFEQNVIDLIFHYINPASHSNPGLACGALLYLSSLLCHKKFIVDFIHRGGIQKILEIPQPSPVATMSSLCLYYVAYSEDAVERICLLPQPTLKHLTEYLLWLLECSHISGRCHSSLFFSMTFSFRSILTLFDSMDGLRVVVNMISTLKILRVEESDLSTDDDVFFDREMAKNASLTLKKYFEAHITIIAQEYRRVLARETGSTPPAPLPAYRSVLSAVNEDLYENIELIQGFTSRDMRSIEKQLIKRTVNLNIAPLLLQLVAIASNWKSYNNRIDVMVSALDALTAVSASKKICLSLCQDIEVSVVEKQSGIKVLLRAVEGDLVHDVQIQKAALRILCNCVTTHSKDLLVGVKSDLQNSSSQKYRTKGLQAMARIWSFVRLNNGIKILLSLLDVKTPITEADSIRALVCKVLVGLSEDDRIRQVLGKLPIFHNEQLQYLMREPILSDKKNEHEKFCKYATSLIERVTGKSLHSDRFESIPMLSRITKSDIIAQTKISYPQKELLMIIHKHLLSQGLEKAADALKAEANLPREEKPCVDSPTTPFSTRTFSTGNGLGTPINKHTKLSVALREPATPYQSRKSSLSLASPFSSPQFERKLPLTPRPRKSLSSVFTLSSVKQTIATAPQAAVPPSLDSIVTGYLREQHAHCSNPVATCPPFSLLRPHHCPEPRYSSYASPNITKRLVTRQSFPRHGGTQGRKQNRRYLYNKLRSTGCIKPSEDDSIFTCCAWVPDGESICVGTQAGDVKIFNYYGQEEVLHSCHGAPISTCYIGRNYKLLTTSASYGTPQGAVWGINTASDQTISFELKWELPEDNFVRFSTSEERVVGTDDITAHVYDLTSGALVRTFYDEANANHYSKNFACFGPRDDLLLNDGCLWDVRAKNMIHKFDKFNDFVSGVFHPSGLEIIINSEVWDVRTFHLLNTCPALDQCQIVFSSSGDVIYGVKHMSQSKDMIIEHAGMLGPYESSFRTFDSFDYSPIGTIDVKKTIFNICPNPDDQVLAVIENGGNLSTIDLDSTCRFYDIGRTKRVGEEESDEEPEDESKEQDTQEGSEIRDLINNIFAHDDDYDVTFDGEESSNNNDEDGDEDDDETDFDMDDDDEMDDEDTESDA